MAEIRRLLAMTRLVTLTGAGGVGKTRLAVQLALEVLGDYPDGASFVDPAPVADGEMLARSVASQPGVKEQSRRALVDTLAEALGGGRVLWVLDNCEHVVEACAVLTDRLLRACPSLRILATSREPLRIDGETARRVPSLSFPDPRQRLAVAALAERDAVRLFVERAGAALRDFTLTDRNAAAVVEICARLDGIPRVGSSNGLRYLHAARHRKPYRTSAPGANSPAARSSTCSPR